MILDMFPVRQRLPDGGQQRLWCAPALATGTGLSQAFGTLGVFLALLAWAIRSALLMAVSKSDLDQAKRVMAHRRRALPHIVIVTLALPTLSAPTI